MSYNDLVNVPSFGKRRENFDSERGELAFYCRDCGKQVEALRVHPVLHRYECPICKGRHVSMGTTASVKDFYDHRHR